MKKAIIVAALLALAACTQASTTAHSAGTYTPPDCHGDRKHQNSC